MEITSIDRGARPDAETLSHTDTVSETEMLDISVTHLVLMPHQDLQGFIQSLPLTAYVDHWKADSSSAFVVFSNDAAQGMQ